MRQEQQKKEEKHKKITSDFVGKLICAIEGSESDETEKTLAQKVKLIFGSKTEKKKEDIRRLKKFNHVVKGSRSDVRKPVKPNKDDKRADLTHEPQKTKLETFIKSFFKRPEKVDRKPVKSLRNYIKQKWKWIIVLIVTYIIVLGGILSAPILVNHLRITSQNQTKKERFIYI